MQFIRNCIESVKDKYHDYEFELSDALSDINFAQDSGLRKLIIIALNGVAIAAVFLPFRIAFAITSFLILISLLNAYTLFSSRKTYFLAHARKIAKPVFYSTEDSVRKEPPKPHRADLQAQQAQQPQWLAPKPRTYNIVRFTSPNQRVAQIENAATPNMTVAHPPKPSRFRVVFDMYVFL